MALTIIHSIASWFLRKRIDQIEEFIKRPHEVQENVCAKLLEAAQSTEMGKQKRSSESILQLSDDLAVLRSIKNGMAKAIPL